MTSIAFPSISKTVRLPNGTTYGFVHLEPSNGKPYVLLLHGFPSSSYDWRHQIKFLSAEGYGVVAPDLLGYGDTDKPKDLAAYRQKKMSEEVISLLDYLSIDKVVGVGHDWGAIFLGRLANYFPERLLSYIFLDIGYLAPTGPFSVDAINEATIQAIGYEVFGYWHFFESADAAELMDRDAKCTDTICYCADPANLKQNLALYGAARAWFEERKTAPMAPYVSAEEIETHDRIFAADMGGYGPSLNWYKAQIANLNTPDEASLAKERLYIQAPTLLVTCTLDYVGVPAVQEQNTRPWVENLQVKELATGHWVQLEKPDELNKVLKDFIEETT